jgi:hypothetical protein
MTKPAKTKPTPVKPPTRHSTPGEWSIHGTVSCYTHGKCRCPKCKGAMAAYMRGVRAARAAAPIPDDVVHGASCYNNYACRCPVCKADHMVKDRLLRQYGTTRAEWIEQVAAAEQGAP